jgi:hypothetical protein
MMMIVCDMLSSNVAQDFDRAYIFSSSMTSRLKSDMCACFLKLGYGIHEDATSVLVVNLDDDNKFFENLSFIVKNFNIKCYIRVEGRDREKVKTDIKQVLNLKTYKDYSRLSRQAISAIFNRVFKETNNSNLI